MGQWLLILKLLWQSHWKPALGLGLFFVLLAWCFSPRYLEANTLLRVKAPEQGESQSTVDFETHLKTHVHLMRSDRLKQKVLKAFILNEALEKAPYLVSVSAIDETDRLAGRNDRGFPALPTRRFGDDFPAQRGWS